MRVSLCVAHWLPWNYEDQADLECKNLSASVSSMTGSSKDLYRLKRRHRMKENICKTSIQKVHISSWMWWYVPLIPALTRQRKMDLCKFEASLVYIQNSRLAKDIVRPYFKKVKDF